MTLIEHFKAMQAKCAQYLGPGSYPKDGMTCNAGDDDAKNDIFISDMIYMLDGPEQRAAEAEYTAYVETNKDIVDRQNEVVATYERALMVKNGTIEALQSKLDRATEALEKALPYLKVLQGPTGERVYKNAVATLAAIKGVE